MVLAALGWDGLARRIDHQTDVADHLRRVLRASGFEVVNDTPLPLVCFTHPRLVGAGAYDALARRLKLAQSAWLSRVLLGGTHAGAARLRHQLRDPARGHGRGGPRDRSLYLRGVIYEPGDRSR